MYQFFNDPWHQSGPSYFDDLSRQMVINLKKNKIKNCVEFVCGLGETMYYIYSIPFLYV